MRSAGLRRTIETQHRGRPLDALTEARLAVQDEPSLVAALEGELQTNQPFASEHDLRAVRVPALIVPGPDDAHDPLIGELYQRCIPHAVTLPNSALQPFPNARLIIECLDRWLPDADQR